MVQSSETSLAKIANELGKLTRVMETLNQNFVVWANKDKPGNIERRYIPVEGYAGGAPEIKKAGE